MMNDCEMVPDLVLDDDHFLKYSFWAPDDCLENRTLYKIAADDPMPRVEKWGAVLSHYNAQGTLCRSAITFDGDWQRYVHQCGAEHAQAHGYSALSYVAWTVECWEPLSLTPSLLCRCGDHGLIQQGKWVKL